MLLQSWQHFTSSPPPQAKVIITMKSRIRHGLDFVASQSPKSMSLAFSCHESEGRALDLRLRLKTTLFVPPSSVKGNVNLPFALHVRRQHTHKHTQAQAHTGTGTHAHVAQHVHWQRQKTEDSRLPSCLPSCLGGCPKMYATLYATTPACLSSSLSVSVSLSLSSVVVPRIGFFYGSC